MSKRALVIPILLATLAIGFLPAQASVVVLSPDQTTYGWPFIYTGNGVFIFVYIVGSGSPGSGLQSVKLAIPTPPCLTLVNGPPGIETGTTLEFGGCATGSHVIAALLYFATDVDACCPIMIRPYESAFGFELEGADCNGNPVTVDRRGVMVQPPGMLGCGAPTMPANPWPQDGATDVSLTPELSWESEAPVGSNLGVFEMRLLLGTTPDPPLVEYYALPPQAVGPLEPGTTYYWKIISYASDFGSTVGPIWQFTTTTPLNVRRTTWGAIKAMYR